MAKIVLDLEQLKAERAQHEEAIKRIDTVINYYFKDNVVSSNSTDEQKVASNKGMSRMQQAIEICEEYLRQGNIVSTTMEFLKLIENKGVKLSRAGLGLAFKSDNSNIYFDQTSRTWKLKSRG